MSTKVPCVAVLPSGSLLGLARRAERTRPGEAGGMAAAVEGALLHRPATTRQELWGSQGELPQMESGVVSTETRARLI